MKVRDVINNSKFDVNAYVYVFEDDGNKECVLCNGFGGSNCPEEIKDMEISYITVRNDAIAIGVKPVSFSRETLWAEINGLSVDEQLLFSSEDNNFYVYRINMEFSKGSCYTYFYDQCGGGCAGAFSFRDEDTDEFEQMVKEKFFKWLDDCGVGETVTNIKVEGAE